MVMLACLLALAQAAEESDAWRSVPLPVPEGVVLEVGGIAFLPDGRPLVCTRRGEVWLVENALAGDPESVAYRLWAEGLQEPLGLLVHAGWIWVVQRGELSRMRDTDGDDRMDELETVCDAWQLSGNYHEYNFGPVVDAEGHLWITTNKPFGDEPFGRVDWRGFALRIAPDGTLQPMCCGLRSPAGIGRSPTGELFYSDNQGEWCGAGKLSLLEPGSFHGHPHGLFSTARPEWRFERPPEPPDGERMPDVAQAIASFRLPAVWFPYDKMGRSPSGFAWDTTGGAFGPFAGQMFIGDQYAASVMRVDLEQVNGHWQGACFPFRSGLLSGVTRVAFAPDGSLFVGSTDRGWPALGRATFGLERLVWTGVVPFEIERVRARPDGFEISFTQPLDVVSAALPRYELSSYTYRLHSPYGSDETDTAELAVSEILVAADARSVILTVDPTTGGGLRAGYVHELHLDGVRSATGAALLHPRAYYTLVERPVR
jgi:glucose/arabinose dehydrogenase